jgi:hypothetical protein
MPCDKTENTLDQLAIFKKPYYNYLMPFELADAFLYLAIAFILIEALWDRFRSVEIPLFLLFAPMAIAAAALLLNGLYLVLVLSVALLLCTLIPNTIARRLAVVICIVILGLFRWDIALFILFIWLLYEFNLFGGADALACFSLLLIRPDMVLAFWLLAGLALGSWIVGLRRDGLSYFKKAFQSLANLTKAPVSEEKLLEEGQPFLWAIFLGSILYILMNAFVLKGGSSAL